MRSTLQTPAGRLLRPWDDGDAAVLPPVFAAPDMSSQGGPLADVAAAAAWIADRRREEDRGSGFSRAVSEDGTVVGSVTVSAIVRRHDTGWVSYWTAPAARGRGVAADATATLARWAFDDLGLFRLELGHLTDNPASCAVATAAGFAVEGLERAKLRYGDQRFDVELHARLAGDPEPTGPAPISRPAAGPAGRR